MNEADRAIAAVRALLGEIRSIQADIERDTREAIDEHEAYLAEVEPEDEERAAKARRGDLGPDWQRLQRQIDLDERLEQADAHQNSRAALTPLRNRCRPR